MNNNICITDLRKMRNVTVDKVAKTVTAQGGCLAADVEEAADVEGLTVPFGAVNETGKVNDYLYQVHASNTEKGTPFL